MQQREVERKQRRQIATTLCLHPGQQALTLHQKAEARRFAAERIRAQLSTEPVDEPAAESLLIQAYAMAHLPLPIRVHWLDGPLQLLYLLAMQATDGAEESARVRMWENVRGSIEKRVPNAVTDSILESAWGITQEQAHSSIHERADESTWAFVWDSMSETMQELVHNSVREIVEEIVWENVGERVWGSAGHSVHESIWEIVWDNAWESVTNSEWKDIYMSLGPSVWGSVMAYKSAGKLAYFRFFDVYLAPNDLHALARFNELVSGYWLGREAAIIVRRPRILSFDRAGQLHSTSGKSLEYHDGWGVYAWHGVRVPEKVILEPGRLVRQDFLDASNVEVRRVIRERMGERFVSELGGVVLNTGSRGILYEVALPDDDPEGAARYVQVQDSSTSHTYFLRVPLTIQSADEAVAWTFQLGVEEYQPARET